MGFLEPLALFGLAGAAVPPLLHLIGRRLPPTVMFPAVRYLTATEREHSRRLKVRNLLLMALRMLIIVLLVLAAARPVARTEAGSGHPPTAIVLVVDNSLSSGAVVGGRRVVDLLAERARHVVHRTTDRDPLWLLLADGTPRRVGRTEALALLDSVRALPLRLDLTEAVGRAVRAVEETPPGGVEIVVVSDLQASALPAGAVQDARILVWEPPTPPPNRGIDSVRAIPDVWTPAGAVVVALGGDAEEPVAVRLRTDDADLSRTVAAAGERVVLEATAPRRGWLTTRVVLDPDELRADDERWIPLWAAEPARVRLGSGVGSFLREAVDVLQAGGRLAAGGDVTLDDRLAAGTTVLFPPDDPVLVGALNRSLAARGVDWRFGGVVEGEWTIAGDVGSARGVPVYRRHRLTGAGTVLARTGGEPWLVRAGRVVIVASRMEPSWTELPVHAGFLAFLDRVVNRIAAWETWTVRTTPGDVVALPPGVQRVRLPGGDLPVAGERRMRAPLEPGVFFLLGAAGDTVGALAVNHDRRESRLAVADRGTVDAVLGPGAVLLDDDGIDRELFGGARRADLSGALLLAALLAVLAEMLIAGSGRFRRT